MVEPPYWLTNKGVDEIDVGEYDKLRKELLTIMNAEETEMPRIFLSKDAEKTPLPAWATGKLWYSLALSSPHGSLLLVLRSNPALIVQEQLRGDW